MQKRNFLADHCLWELLRLRVLCSPHFVAMGSAGIADHVRYRCDAGDTLMALKKRSNNGKTLLRRDDSIDSYAFIHLAFYTVFPGFFIYHFLVGREYIPAIFGGYSTSIAVILLPFLCIAYVRDIRQNTNHFSSVEAAFLGFTGYFAAVVLSQIAWGANWSASVQLLSVTLQFVAIFIIVKLADRESAKFKWSLIGFFVTLSGIIFLNVSDGAFIVASPDLQNSVAKIADYQGYAFVYIVVAIYVLVSLNSRVTRLLVYGAAVFALFLNGARAEFIGLVLLIPLIELSFAKHKYLIIAVGILLVCAVTGLLSISPEVMLENRVSALLTDYEIDASVIERRLLLHAAWDTITSNPLFGNFNSYDTGEWAHNALSAWVDLGLIGFQVYLGLLVGPIIGLLRRFPDRSKDPDYVLALSTAFLVMLLAMTAKSFTYQMLPVSVGLYARLVSRERRTSISVREPAIVPDAILTQAVISQPIKEDKPHFVKSSEQGQL